MHRPPLVALMARVLMLLPAVVDGCRWALVAGVRPSCMSDLFLIPSHSLAAQSHLPAFTPLADQAPLWDPAKFSSRNHGENQDGWGIGWFDRAGPGRMRSSNPAMDSATLKLDPELEALEDTCSSLLFGHLRAVTDGDRATVNSHPFQFGPILWMHNGGVPTAIQERLSARLSCPTISKMVTGNTDSEFAGALFAQELDGDVCLRSTSFELASLEQAMTGVIRNITHETTDQDQGSSLNFAASDGRSIVITRYRTTLEDEPPSLYLAITEGTDSLAASSTVPLTLLRTAAFSNCLLYTSPSPRDS
eukprot:TRINITY_DN22541_c0_g1_i2.p1 TRINITY_DN22541_c0_g1~~TRINITY_DN22541_c0_g1_i2.p1  ORF type:complete len:305 (-),score=57.37 TRINITY_DN22541_c0_g1_i2:144-1058(-)